MHKHLKLKRMANSKSTNTGGETLCERRRKSGYVFFVIEEGGKSFPRNNRSPYGKSDKKFLVLLKGKNNKNSNMP